MGSCVHVEGVVQDEGREVGEDQAMPCPGARLGLWSNKSSCALDQHVPGYSKYFVDTRSSSHPARTLVTGGQTEAPTGEGTC